MHMARKGKVENVPHSELGHPELYFCDISVFGNAR